MDKKKIVFIAVPDEGKDDALVSRARNITAKLYLEINNLTIKDVAFVPAFNNTLNKVQVPEGTNEEIAELAEAVRKLAMADEAIFGEHCVNSNKCRILQNICKTYGIKQTMIDETKGENKNGKQ